MILSLFSLKHVSYDWMTEVDESLAVLCGALTCGEGGIEDVQRGDGELTPHLGREEKAAAEGLTVSNS